MYKSFRIIIFITAIFICADIIAQNKSDEKNAAIENIMSRTSIRRYQEKKILDADVEIMLRAAMAAPTAVNRQPWHFVVVSNSEILESLGGRSKDAPLAIVVCGDMEKALEREACEYWVQDCSAATQNLLLAAHALGLGAVWQGVYPIKERVRKVSEILALAPQYVPLSIVALGYPDESPAPKDKWKAENVRYVK